MSEQKRIKTAFVLGAGLGTRLRPLTADCPKPLLPINGKPMITHAFDRLIEQGVERLIVNTHHAAHRYAETFPDLQWRGVPIVFNHEPILLDTAGGLKAIEPLLTTDDPLIVYNGDIVATFPLNKLVEAHVAGGAEVTLALRSSGEPRNVGVDSQGRIQDLRGRRKIDGLKMCLFTGIYVVERPFLKRLIPGKIESVVEVFLRMLNEVPQVPVHSVVLDEGDWCDVGTIEEYQRRC